MFQPRYLLLQSVQHREYRERFIAYAQRTGKGWLLYKQPGAQSSQQQYFTLVRFLLAHQQPKDCCLAGAVTAYESDVLARVYLESDTAKNLGAAVGFVDIVKPEKHVLRERAGRGDGATRRQGEQMEKAREKS
jgi:hypothetical protein